VRVKEVVDALQAYEGDLVADATAGLPATLQPGDDVTTLAAVAETYGVSVDAVENQAFPEHNRLGRLLVRPAVLATISAELSAGMSLSEAESVLDEYGLTDTSAVLSAVDYRVVWDGLSGGTLEEQARETDE